MIKRDMGDVKLSSKQPTISKTAPILKGHLNALHIIGRPDLAGGFSS